MSAPGGDQSALDDIAWSCVVDDTPAIWVSLIPWIATLIELGEIPASRIHVHHVCRLRPEFDALFRRLGVRTHARAVFDPRFPHCNKLRQPETSFGDVSRVVLSDVDTAVATLPPVQNLTAPIVGKLVDGPNPPLDVLARVFQRGGLVLPAAVTQHYTDDSGGHFSFETLPANFNGGFYAVETRLLPQLGAAWEKWARWLIDNASLLERWTPHVDQIAFCMAANELGEAVESVPDSWNFPLHLTMRHGGLASGMPPPYVLHHHADLDAHHCLARSRVAPLDEAVQRVNGAVQQFSRRHSIGRRPT